jgi:hypothetical protein
MVDTNTGLLVDYMPPPPLATLDYEYQWDGGVRRWVRKDTFTFIKRAKWDSVKLIAKARDAANITVGAHEFEADVESRAVLMQAVTIAQLAVADGLSFSVELDKANGSSVTVDAGQLKAIIRAIHTRTESIRATARSLRAQIQAATTPAEVEAVQWP